MGAPHLTLPHFPFTESVVKTPNRPFSLQLYHSTIEINFAKLSSRYPHICHTKNREKDAISDLTGHSAGELDDVLAQ